MQQLNKEMEALDSQLSEINTLEGRIREIEPQEASVAAHSAEAQKKQLELQRIDGEASAFAILLRRRNTSGSTANSERKWY